MELLPELEKIPVIMDVLQGPNAGGITPWEFFGIEPSAEDNERFRASMAAVIEAERQALHRVS